MILFVDDEYNRVDTYIDELQMAGYEVESRRDIDEALRFLEEKLAAIELLVLDVMMAPGDAFANEDTRDGLDTGIYVVERVRALSASLPIIILTNRQDDLLRLQLEPYAGLTLLSKRDNLSDVFPDAVRQVLAGEE